MGDGRIVFCDGNTGDCCLSTRRHLHLRAHRGSPWGTLPGTDGAIYVTQGGNVPGSGDISAISGIQRVRPDGSVDCCALRWRDTALRA